MKYLIVQMSKSGLAPEDIQGSIHQFTKADVVLGIEPSSGEARVLMDRYHDIGESHVQFISQFIEGR